MGLPTLAYDLRYPVMLEFEVIAHDLLNINIVSQCTDEKVTCTYQMLVSPIRRITCFPILSHGYHAYHAVGFHS